MRDEATAKCFNRFKDHKRCSYMIARALEGDREFTTAQITRLLKQLGLKKEKSENEMQVSDSETLMSMRFWYFCSHLLMDS